MTDWPYISVIIPVRNEEKYIARTVKYIQDQEYPPDKLEIIVVDGNSDDDSRAIVRKLAGIDNRIKLFNNEKRLSSAARNIGIQNASGEIIIFIDGHTYIDNTDLLRNTAKLMKDKDVSILSRPQFLDTPENDNFQKAVSIARKSGIGHGPGSTIYSDKEAFVEPSSSGASYRREVFQKAGYFDERFDACEDLELNYRMAMEGYRAYLSPKLSVYYYPRSSAGALFSQMKRYGIGRMRMAARHSGSVSLGTLIPALFTAGIFVLPLLSILWFPLIYILVLLYGGYALIILATSGYYAIKYGVKSFPLLMVVYPIIHFGLGWGFLFELFRTVTGRGINRHKGEGR